MNKILASLLSFFGISVPAPQEQNIPGNIMNNELDALSKDGYTRVRLSYYHEIELKNEAYILRFNLPVNWVIDNSASEIPSIIFAPKGQNLNTSEVFVSLAMFDYNSNKDANMTDVFRKLKIGEGYTEDTKLSSMLTYDKRKITALELLNIDTEYRRIDVFVAPTEDANMLIIIALQINEIGENLRAKHYPIILDLVNSLKIQPAAEDARTKTEYLDVVLH